MKYTESGYASSRLLDTYIVHNNEIQLVCDLRGSNFVLLNEKGNRSEASLKDMDLSPPRIGNVNYGLSSFYFSRVPLRRDYRQGFRGGSIRTTWAKNEEKNIWYEIGLNDMWSLNPYLRKEYPTLKDCVERVQDKYFVRAFCPDFSLDSSGALHHKSRNIVGEITQDEKSFKLFNRYSYLQEALDMGLQNA